jgi:hypothetical protein
MSSSKIPGANVEIVRERLLTAVRRVREMQMFRNTPMIVAAEAAPGPIAATFEYLLIQERKKPNHGLGPLLVMHEYGKDRKPGVPKTKESTELMVRYCSDLLRNKQVAYSENLMAGIDTTPQGMIDKFQKQLTEFRCEVKYNKNDIFSVAKYKWTGPQDDLLVSWMTACFWLQKFKLSAFPGYSAIKQMAASA